MTDPPATDSAQPEPGEAQESPPGDLADLVSKYDDEQLEVIVQRNQVLFGPGATEPRDK